MTEEEWRDIPGYIGSYQASNLGRVRSLPRIVQSARWGLVRSVRRAGKILTLRWGRDGYATVSLSAKDHGVRQFRVHRLVLLAFSGPCPPGMEGAHNDGDPKNNRLGNLSWKTPVENAGDKYLHGTSPPIGSASPFWVERCIRGHELTDENTYVSIRKKTGQRRRQCRACRTIRMALFHRKAHTP